MELQQPSVFLLLQPIDLGFRTTPHSVIIPYAKKTFSIFRDSFTKNNYSEIFEFESFFIDTNFKTLYKHRSFDTQKCIERE